MSLVGWWKLNGDTKDSSIYKKHATNSGATLTTGGPLGSCYEFNDDYMVVDTDEKYIFKDINHTISCWVYPISLATSNTYNYIVAFGNNSVGNQISVGITSSGNIYQSAYTSPIITFDYTVSLNTWYHILITHIDGISYLYINGELKEQKTVDFSPTTGKFYIGSHTGNASYFKNAYFTDIRVYNHVLSLKEIKDLAKCKVLHYTFNQFQEPTTNLLYDDKIVNWTIGNPTASVTRTTIEPNYKYKIVSTTGGSFRFYIPLTKLINGETYNLSYNYEIKTPDGNFYMTDWCDRSITKIDDGYYATAYGSCAEYSSVYRFMDFYISENTEVEIWNVQLEQKDHPTPFVNGSRTGKVYDCSGFNNHSNLTESTTPKWVEDGPIGNGCYEFKQNQKINVSNILNNKFTVSFWMKGISDKVKHVIGNANGFFSNGAGWFIGCASSAADMYFEVQSSDSRTPIRFYSNRVFDWSHFVAVYNEGEMKTYLNGNLQSSGFRVMNSTSNDIILGDKNISTYYMDGDLITDIRFYATDLSEDTIKEIYQSRASIDNNKNVYVNKIKEDKYVDAILDYSTWTIGTTGSQTGFSRNGLESENYIIEGQDPFGNIIPIWEARPDATSGADGGWKSDLFSIDNTKYYRFSTWVKRTVKGNGHFYLGTEGYNSANADIGVLYRSTGAVNTNPYFNVNSNWGEWESGVENKWYLVVGHIFPVNSGTGSNHPDSGVYDINGNKIKDAEADFVWQTDVVKSRHRSYLYYSTDTSTRQQWCYPRVDVCDGSEPTISDLINGVDYEHYKILNGEESSGSFRKTGIIKVNEINTVGPTNGLVFYMPLNGDTKDYSGNKNDGTNYGAKIVQGLGNKLAYEFDGSSYIYNSNVFLDSDPVFTVCGWFKRTGSWSSNSLWGLGTNGNAISTYQSNSESQTGFDKYNSTTYYVSATINLNEWHFITWIKNAKGTFNSSILYIYVDGILTTLTQQRNNNTTANVTSGFTLGRVAYDQSLYGSKSCMQDIRIYDRALSPQEISWLYDMYNPNKNTGAKIFNNNILYAHSFKEGY